MMSSTLVSHAFSAPHDAVMACSLLLLCWLAHAADAAAAAPGARAPSSGSASVPGAPALAGASPQGYGHPPWLGECESVYLDVGTNIGVQIRKFFEPDKYPEAKILGTFDQAFGPVEQRRKSSCALGMEPNPHHLARLHALERGYNERGFRTHIYPFAAWKEEGTLDLRTDMADFDEATDTANTANEEWGAHIAQIQEITTVRAVDLSDFIKSLPQGRIKLMKLDIEGAEYETLARAIPEDAICNNFVDQMFMEAHWHIRGWKGTWNGPTDFASVAARIGEHHCKEGTPSVLLEMDDESYVHDVDSDFRGRQSPGPFLRSVGDRLRRALLDVLSRPRRDRDEKSKRRHAQP